VGQHHRVTPILPTDFTLHLVPKQILQTRVVSRGAHRVQQVLVNWNNLPFTLATWEDYEALCQEFPRATAWGASNVPRRGLVSSTPTDLAMLATKEAMKERPNRPNPKYIGKECQG